MKRLTLIFLLALTTFVHAQSLVDLTPGGYQSGNFPPAFWKLFTPQMHFFDEAAQGWFRLPEGWRYFNNWVSLYGDLDGGQYFFTNLFVLAHPTRANVWWNFTGTEHFGLAMIHVTGSNSDGVSWEHLYQVRDGRRTGEGTITLEGVRAIKSIAFYGYER